MTLQGSEKSSEHKPLDNFNQENNPRWNLSFRPLQGFPRLTWKHEISYKVYSMYLYS